MGRRHSKYPQREIAILRFFETFDGHFLCRRPIQAVAEHHRHSRLIDSNIHMR